MARMPAEFRRAVNLDELGVSGTRILAGLLNEETAPELAGSRGMAVSREMGFDATLAMCLHATINPLRSADWFVEPASEDPVHIEQADSIHNSLWDFGTMSFDDVLRQQLRAMKQYGVGAAELIYEVVPTGQFAGQWGWEKLAWRSPLSLYRWNVEPVKTASGGTRRELVEIVQRDPVSGTLLYLPKDKVLLFVNDLEGENYLGRSAFRECYEAWRYKRAIGRLEAIALERCGMGRMKVTLPQDYSDSERDMGRQIVENDRIHENAGIVTTEAVPVEVLHYSLEGAAFRAAWEAYDAALCFPFLSQYLLLGQRGNSGAYSLSQDHSQIQLTQLNGDANQFEQVLNLSPGIPLLIAINYSDSDPSQMPKLQHGDIGRKDMELMGKTLLALSQGGWVLPTAQDEDTLRKFVDLPERDPLLGPEALVPLIQQVLPPTWWGTPHEARTAVNPAAKALSSGTPVSKGQQAADAQEGGVGKFSERDWVTIAERAVRARMPWRRPQVKGGRVTSADAVRVRMGEYLLDYFEQNDKPRMQKPDPPSVRIAKRRRPYEVARMSADAEKVAQINALAKAGGGGPAHTNGNGKRKMVVSPAAIVAKRGEGMVQAVLAKIGEKDGSGT
jgi:hypothetical protein